MSLGLRESCAFIQRLLREAMGEVGGINAVRWGFSQGGTLAQVSVWTWNGEPFAALVGMSGWMQDGNMVKEIGEGKTSVLRILLYINVRLKTIRKLTETKTLHPPSIPIYISTAHLTSLSVPSHLPTGPCIQLRTKPRHKSPIPPIFRPPSSSSSCTYPAARPTIHIDLHVHGYHVWIAVPCHGTESLHACVGGGGFFSDSGDRGRRLYDGVVLFLCGVRMRGSILWA